MDRKAHAISFARQAYLRQGLDTLYGQSFDDLLLPELDDAWDVAEAEQLIWCEGRRHNCAVMPMFSGGIFSPMKSPDILRKTAFSNA